ncbi:MAG: type II toxin-antitoxin system VapC family toxin [Candidatus Freyarchaeum deiterrae]
MKLALDTSVIISHFKGDEFSGETLKFFRWAGEKRMSLVLSEIVYAELYTGIFLSGNPNEEENRVQKFIAANNISVHLSGSLDVAKSAGQMFSEYLLRKRKERERILPDFLVAAHAETYSDALVTWNPADFKEYMSIPVLTPSEVVEKSES